MVEALRAELKRLPNDLATGSMAAGAMVLAAELDNPNSATSKSMCAKELREIVDRLRELAPPAKENDALDDLSARRTARRSATA